ncbi:MAG TPA: cupin domain-containing protein [Beijerinckiaceae bacterium]|jgi:mannose-6-phosphate isomerase-like protein (cupin superfamily)|nr:cupin domain-containing protein [Beijerinckiaceae bacterium]
MNDVVSPSAEKPDLEALHERAEAMMTGYSYHRPDLANSKGIVRLAKTDLLRCSVQVVKKDGGENNLHYHTNGDSFWMVLKGKVRFYGPEDRLLGEFGPQEGICTPAYGRYWFENAGDDILELLHVSGLSKPQMTSTGRTNVAGEMRKNEYFDSAKA